MSLVPPLAHFLATHPSIDHYELRSLEHITVGAAPLGAALEQVLADRIDCAVGQGYGMTESSGTIAVPDYDRPRRGSCGKLLPGTQARIVDAATLEDVLPGCCGEIWFRGPQAFRGYLNQPDATAAAITAEGWVRTGDIGYFDDDGYLYVTDRLKELIKVKGFQVAPAELEALLLSHPLVADVAVIGRPDDRAGEVPVAYIVGRGAVDPDEIKAWLTARVVEYKQLREVVLCDSIPKTASGKILRRVIRSQDAERVAAFRVNP
jgi:4-coumarate--CoA ligase